MLNIQTNPTTQAMPEILPTLDTFFDRYDLDECQEEIWNLLSAYFGQEPGDLAGSIARSNTVYFCRNIDNLLKQLNKAWKTRNEVAE